VVGKYFFVFSANGTGRVAEDQAEKIDIQAGSAVRHLPGNNGHRRLRRLQVRRRPSVAIPNVNITDRDDDDNINILYTI